MTRLLYVTPASARLIVLCEMPAFRALAANSCSHDPNPAPELLHRCVEPRFHGADRAFQSFGDVFVGLALSISQDDDLSQLRTELLLCGLYLFVKFSTTDPPVGL